MTDQINLYGGKPNCELEKEGHKTRQEKVDILFTTTNTILVKL